MTVFVFKYPGQEGSSGSMSGRTSFGPDNMGLNAQIWWKIMSRVKRIWKNLRILFVLAVSLLALGDIGVNSPPVTALPSSASVSPRAARLDWAHASVAQYSCDIRTPHPYPANYWRSWDVTHVRALAIRVQFSHYEVEFPDWFAHDYAGIDDGAGDCVGTFLCNQGTFWSPWVDGDSLMIWFVSDGTYNYYGFDVVTFEVAHYNDSDADGLWDWEEIEVYGTSPLNLDSDWDGLDDYQEVMTHHTNATNPDTDADGLTDGEEIYRYHCNATDANTDGDWWGDGFEVNTLDSDPADFWDPGAWYAFLVCTVAVAVILILAGGTRFTPRRGVPREVVAARVFKAPPKPPVSQVLARQREQKRDHGNLVRRIADTESRLIWIKHLPAFAEYLNIVVQILAETKHLATPGKVPGDQVPAKRAQILALLGREAVLHAAPAIQRAISKVRLLEETLRDCKRFAGT